MYNVGNMIRPLVNILHKMPLEVIKLVEVKGPSINDVHTEGEGLTQKQM